MKKRILSVLVVMLMCSCFTVIGGEYSFASGDSVSYGWPTKSHKVIGHWGKEEGHLYPYHYGIDIQASKGAKVRAAEDGKVITAGLFGGYGYCVIIKHSNGQCTLYGHNSKLKTQKGKKVKKGQVIAYVGGTGTNGKEVYGYHLHFGIYKNKAAIKKEYSAPPAKNITIDPEKKLKGNAKSVTATHIIRYSANGGTAYYTENTVKTGGSFTIPSAVPTRNGYQFKGYYLKRLADQTWYVPGRGWCSWSDIKSYGYSPRTYKNGEKCTVDSVWTDGMKASNYRFYAQWDISDSGSSESNVKTHSFSFGLNDGSGNFNKMTVAEGDEFTMPSQKPTKKGYTFKGWYVKRTTDNVWYYGSSHGWMNWDKAKEKGYKPKTYAPGRTMRLDSTWTKGCANASFRFYAQWKKN